MAEKKIKFHLPGLSYNYPVNMLLMDLMKQKPHFFRENMEIGSFFGEFPTSLWNGGRFAYGVQCPEEMVRTVVKNINGMGIPIRYTFTNPLIYEEDLAEPFCNFCMQAGDNGMNEVLVFSPVLENYIREKYPSYKINSTTCKEIKNIDQLNEELKKDYYLVVLDQNLNHDFDFISRIEDRERIELLVNSCCSFNCGRRAEHYTVISAQQRVVLANREIRAGKDPQEALDRLPDYVKERLPQSAGQGKFQKDSGGNIRIPLPEWNCVNSNYDNPYRAKGTRNYISPEEIWEKYVPMGFTNFKLEGRTVNLITLIDYYVDYLCKPEYRDEVRHTLLTELNMRGILTMRPTWWVKSAGQR